MSSNRKNNKNTRNSRKNLSEEPEKRKRRVPEESYDEADRILEQLDKMGLEDKENASVRAKKMLREDKEAIRKMKEEMDRLQEDDLDYLEDEKSDDYLPEVDVDAARTVVVKSSDQTVKNKSEEEKNNSKAVGKKSDTEKNVIDSKNNETAAGKDAAGIAQAGSDREKEKAGIKEEENDTKKDEAKTEEGQEDEGEVKLDFFKSLEREYPKHTTALRKKQPKMPEVVRKDSAVKKVYRESKSIFFVGVAVTVLLVVLFAALAIDASHKPVADKQVGKTVNTDFLSMDTKPMITLMENYYTALYKEEYDAVRECLYGGKDIAEKDLKEQSKKIQRYREVVSDFSIDQCYVQQGLHENEYIVYMKFQLKIQSVETPAVGIYTTYLIAEDQKVSSDAAAPAVTYRLYMGLNDKDSDIYRYISKMKKAEAVVKLFADTDAELAEACKKDQNLKEIVEALGGNSDN